ncbi:hypothetical protein LK472_06290 [Leuconostoc lactis]|uniref:phage tail spike protein n=1 Tax=Leuconostoc lactis TaxID=1246 RepID=UPI001D10D69B|nr:phage tail spike protein [Leuconostoc lactis]MCC2745015.1 hypothetical protein [Leuconostoc lactis]MCC2755553.1 hypothetical protein [Leuconostoc lactis]
MSSPIIFEKGTRDFSTLGLGLLSDAIQATTTEELNGQFIFEMDYPVSGNNADLIKENRIIVVNSGHILKRQGFIIRQIVRKIDLTMTVYAEHVSYATLDVALAPIGTISGDAKTALEHWKRMLVPAVDFTVDSDILTTNSTSIGAPEFETARQGLGGHVGSILDVWGGEYQFDNWHIRLLKQRGKSTNAIIAYGRNLISFEQDTNIVDTYTSVYPYYQENSGDDGNKTHFLPERTVDSEFVGKYPNPKVLMLDLSNKFKDVADYSETNLRNYALSYIQSNNIGVPKVNMKISTVDLSRATGGFSEDIDLGDTVNVYFEKLGITTSAKVIKAVWNVLSDDYDKFEIGARRSSLTESISELATTADENANKALNQALVALQSADGKTTIYYLDSSDPWPTNPNENDTAFVKDGENSIMYRYMFNNDTGVFSWVKILDSMSADQIKQRVSDALESGKAYSNQLVADNVAQVNAVLDDVQAKQADLTAQQAELDSKAQGYANKALADAKADTQATATQTAKDASDALAKAKTDLTTSLNKEVTDRANAVTALDKKATDAINQAKTDAQSALNALQIGGRNLLLGSKDFTPIAGGQWNFGGGATTVPGPQGVLAQRSNGAWAGPKYDVKNLVDRGVVNTTDTYVMSAWVKNDSTTDTHIRLYGPSAITPTNILIANLPAGSDWVRISTPPMKFSSVEITTTNNIRFESDTTVTGGNILQGGLKFEKGTLATDYTQAPEDIVLDYTTKDNVISRSLTQYQATNDGKVTKAQSDATQALGLVATKVSQTDYNTKTGDLDSKYTAVKQTADQATTDIVAIKSTNTSQDTKINTLTSDVSGTKQSISDIQTEQGKQSTKINTIQTDVSGTKQDISDIKDANGVQDGKIASISTTVDGLSSSFSTYKTTNDGKVAKAQADITANATAISQKVSQTAYDAKTGQLQTDLNTTMTTANTSKQDIVAIKSDNTKQDARMTTIESDANGVKTTVSNLQTDLGKANGSISTLQQRADGFDATVTKVNNLSVGGRNLLIGTKGYTFTNPAQWNNSGVVISDTYQGLTINQTNSPWGGPKYLISDLIRRGFVNTTDTFIMSTWIRNTSTTPIIIGFYYGNSAVTISPNYDVVATLPANSDWVRVASPLIRFTSLDVTTGAFRFEPKTATNGGYIQQAGLKLENGNMPTAWSPAPEDTDNKISTVSQTVDSISSIVSDPTTGLTKRVQTAEGTLSQVTGADIPALQKATYWQAPNGYDLNTYLTQGSTFFRDTTARTNAPTTSTKWMYLVVERTPNGDRVTQTAWYDTQTDAKITYRRQYDGKWGAWYANDNNSVASISQTNEAIRTEISNRQTGDTNTLTQAKDFTTSSISNSESGMRSLITQTSDSIIAKVDTKTDSATVLSLLKDNWSIGIADNAGAITNGIVGNSTNMSLISNNVVINAPSTQIKGTAWINSAMIANGAIGKAQIGDASIDTAKIASLDVAKLTGNVSSFIQSNWNGVFASTMIDNTGMSINGGNTTTKFDTSGAHYSNSSGISATYSFGKWSDSNSNATSATGLYLGATGSENAFINILGTNGSAALVLAGSAMDYGSNLNVMQGTLNSYVNVNIRTQLHFKGNKYNSPSYIEINESNRTFNFFTGGGSVGGGNYFYFNQNVISAGTFSSTSVLSKKNIKSVYDEDALSEIAKTQLVNFEYKNRIGQNHVSPIIDDVNSEKEYYIPKTILGQDNKYVDLYSMISMTWKAIQQLNEKIGDK